MIVKVVDPKSAEGAGDIDSVKHNESPIVGNALQPEAARAEAGTLQRGRARIMVVDDDDMMRKLLTKILKAQSYDVDAMPNAVEAMRSMQVALPDLILMDVQMPMIDGIELTRHLRNTEAYAGIPVLMLTGRGEQAVIDKCRDAGATDVILKPFERETLLKKVQQYSSNVTSIPDRSRDEVFCYPSP